MRTQFRLLAATGALGAVVPVAGAQSARSYFTDAPPVDVAVRPATPSAARAPTMRDIVARTPLPALAAPVRDDDRWAALHALRSEFGGIVLHRDGDASGGVALFADEASADEDADEEDGSAAGAGGGIGLVPVLGVLAGGGAAWAAIAASNSPATTAPAVSATPVEAGRAPGATAALPASGVAPVLTTPEPSAVVLMATGSAGVLVLVRRRRGRGA